jgi:hypothetical protein
LLACLRLRVDTLRNASLLKPIEEPHLALRGAEGEAPLRAGQQRLADAVKAARSGRIAPTIDGTKAIFLIESTVRVSIRTAVHVWGLLAEDHVLLQPTSGAAERFFSLAKANTSSLHNWESPGRCVVRWTCLYSRPDQ